MSRCEPRRYWQLAFVMQRGARRHVCNLACGLMGVCTTRCIPWFGLAERAPQHAHGLITWLHAWAHWWHMGMQVCRPWLARLQLGVYFSRLMCKCWNLELLQHLEADTRKTWVPKQFLTDSLKQLSMITYVQWLNKQLAAVQSGFQVDLSNHA